MGVAPTIDQLAKTNTAFQKYIDEQTDAMNKAALAAKTDMDAAMKQFYSDGQWDDAKPLAGGSYQHLETTATWSLTHVIDMINTIRGAIFGGSAAPLPSDPNSKLKTLGDGTAIQKPTDPKLVGLMAMMGGYEAVIAAAAFDVIQGILTAFTSSTQTTIARNFDKKPLLPGLMLFCTVMQNQYHRSDFFTDTTIVQTFYIFETRMSIKQAGDLGKFNQVQSLMTQQTAFETQAAKISDMISNLDVTRTDYLTALQAQTTLLSTLNDLVDKLQLKIDSLRSANRALAAARIADRRRLIAAA